MIARSPGGGTWLTTLLPPLAAQVYMNHLDVGYTNNIASVINICEGMQERHVCAGPTAPAADHSCSGAGRCTATPCGNGSSGIDRALLRAACVCAAFGAVWCR